MQKKTKKEIESIVNKVINKTKTRNPRDICSYYNINLFYHNLNKCLKGYFFCQSRICNIVIDENVVEIFRDILIAHELGHYFLHRDTLVKGFKEQDIFSPSQTDTAETEANLFSSELLLEDEQVLRELQNHTFFEAAHILCVPPQLISYKLSMMQEKGIINHWEQYFQADFLKGGHKIYNSKNDHYFEP